MKRSQEDIEMICEEIKLRREKRQIDMERSKIFKMINDNVSPYSISIILNSLRNREEIIDCKLSYISAIIDMKDYIKRLETL